MKRARAFTLIEVLIVVVLLAVLAAIVIPAFANATTSAKDSALAFDLSLLRRFMLVYKSQHGEVSPGYPDGVTTAVPSDQAFRDQALLSSNDAGETAAPKTPGYSYGPYLSRIPANPFNNKDTIQMVPNGQAFPAEADDSYGWICKPETGELRSGNTGSRTDGTRYYDL